MPWRFVGCVVAFRLGFVDLAGVQEADNLSVSPFVPCSACLACLLSVFFLQICGVHGAYSKSCEIVMRVMRDNRESLMAVLEAFVYDPLFAWKLGGIATVEPPTHVAEGGKLADRVATRLGLTCSSI